MKNKHFFEGSVVFALEFFFVCRLMSPSKTAFQSLKSCFKRLKRRTDAPSFRVQFSSVGVGKLDHLVDWMDFSRGVFLSSPSQPDQTCSVKYLGKL